MLTLGSCLTLALVLFAIGAFGVIARRNLLVILMSIELMLNAANLVLIAFSRHFAGGGAPLALPGRQGLADGGQVFALMSMAVAACEVAVGLALLIAIFRLNRSVMTVDAVELRG